MIFNDYISDFARREKHQTAMTYHKLLSPFECCLIKRKLENFDRDDVLLYLEEQKWSNSSKNTFLAALRGWAKFQRGYSEDGKEQARLSRIEGIRGFKMNREEKPALTIEQLKNLFSVMDPDTFSLFWNLLWFGFRVGELQLIKSIDWEKRELVVETEKAGGTRTLFFDDYTSRLLKISQEKELLNLPPLVIWKRLKKYSYYIQPIKLTPHICRHTFGTHMAEIVGSDRDILRRMLGHAPKETTDIYVHPSLERIRKVMVEKHYLNELEGSSGPLT